MSALAQRLLDGFTLAFEQRPAFEVRAPGRVNIIGEHTDYNGGFVLPCAIGCETRIAVRPRGDRLVRAVALDFDGETDEFHASADVEHHPARGWRDYIRGMVAKLVDVGHSIRGADIAIAGDIPRGTGLSSSASLEVAVGFALLEAAGIPVAPVQVALLAQAAENDFVGMRCGNMDQLASAASVQGHALLIDCRSTQLTPIPLPTGSTVLIIQSGVVRGLVEGHYNRRRASCEEAASALDVELLRESNLDAVETTSMAAEARRRARHIVTENARVLAAADALRADDLKGLGLLMRESHASMRDDFEITTPKVDELAEITANAIGFEGGARMTGGGFGGAVVAILRDDAVDRVIAQISKRYRTPNGLRPEIMKVKPTRGAEVLKV